MASKSINKAVALTLFQRIALTNIIGAQTHDKLRKCIGREISEDDSAALYSVRRKVRPSTDEIAPYFRSFGGDKTVDLAAVQQNGDKVDAALDTVEARLLKSFLSGWMKNEGSLADLDWAAEVMEQCS